MNWLAKYRRQRLFRPDISYRLDSWTDIHTTTDCTTSTTVMVSSHTAVMEMHVVVYSTVKLSAWRRDYFASWRSAKYCDEYVCLSVCMFVCPLSYLGNGLAELHQFLCTSPVAVGRPSPDGVVTSYVLPVLWMTSRFHTIGSIAQHVFLSYESITAETVALIPTEVRSMIKISKYTYMSCVEHEGRSLLCATVTIVGRIVDDYCYPYVVSSSPRPGRCLLPRSHYRLVAAKRCPFPGSPVRVYRASPPYTVSPTVSISYTSWGSCVALVRSSVYLFGPIPWGHSGPLCHALSLSSSSSSSWTSMRRRRATSQ